MPISIFVSPLFHGRYGEGNSLFHTLCINNKRYWSMRQGFVATGFIMPFVKVINLASFQHRNRSAPNLVCGPVIEVKLA